MVDFEEKRLKEEIKKLKPKLVFLQLPEGLKPEAPRLAAVIEDAGALPIISSDPCYGACDLAVSEAQILGADLLVHYGHTPVIRNCEVPTIYIEARAKKNIKEAIVKALSYLEEWNRIGLVTTVQHIDKLDEAKKMLEAAGKTVFVGDFGDVKYAGQVLGCDFSNAQSISENVEAYVFVGGGRFHAIGVAITTEKPTIVADPYEGTAWSIHGQVRRVIMQRWGDIAEAKKAKTFGILISLKSGQMKLKNGIWIKEKLENYGLTAILMAVREVTPTIVIQFPGIEAFVNTACPRLSLDDALNYDRPLLSINETLVMLGEMRWEELLRKGWFGNAI